MNLKTKTKSKEELKEHEDLFQEYQRHYRDFGDKESSDKCFYFIYDCVKNTALKKAKGKVIPDLDEVVMDATLDIFNKWKNKPVDINKLSSFCYYPLIQRMYDKNKQITDREVSLEAWLEYEYKEE